MASSSSNGPPLVCANLEELNEVLIPASVNNVELAKRTLVGQLYTTKAQNKAATKGIIAKAWSTFNNIQISDLGKNKFLFTFEVEKDCKEVMKRSPWYFMNHLMCLQYWNLSIIAEEIVFHWNPLWIQIHNLSMEFLNSTNGTTIFQKVGRVMEIEESILKGCVLRTFLRAKVLLDVTKYDQSIAAQPVKSITAILKEHKQRYGDSTKNTARKFQKQQDPEGILMQLREGMRLRKKVRR